MGCAWTLLVQQCCLCTILPVIAVHDNCRALQVDPRIMGGMVVDIGDKHIDMSISSRVKKIQQLVMQAV